jgi:hypothetical protein
MNHASGAVAPDTEMVQVGDAVWQRAMLSRSKMGTAA